MNMSANESSKVSIADAHSHINAVRGLSANEFAEAFRKANGWFVALVGVSPWDYGAMPPSLRDAYLKSVDIHVKTCSEMRSKGVSVACIDGFYPGDVDKLLSMGLKPSEVLNLGREVLQYELTLCRNGLLDGIGEVGRQHYKAMPLSLLVSELLMEEAIKAGSEEDCVIHLHLEDIGPDTVLLTHEVIKRLNVKPSSKIIFHHARPDMIPAASSLGYSATVFGRKEVLRAAVALKAWGFMVESDFPGVMLNGAVTPWSLAEVEVGLLRDSLATEEFLYKVNIDNIVKSYGVSPP